MDNKQASDTWTVAVCGIEGNVYAYNIQAPTRQQALTDAYATHDRRLRTGEITEPLGMHSCAHRTTNREDPDPDTRALLEATMREWENSGLINGGWNVSYGHDEGAYITAFSLPAAPEHTPPRPVRLYHYSETEMAQYAIGLADHAPHLAGPAATRLAEHTRQEWHDRPYYRAV